MKERKNAVTFFIYSVFNDTDGFKALYSIK